MRWLVILVLAASAVWSGLWVVGRAGVQAGLEGAIEAARQDGWQITYDDLSVQGFPNRFDTRVTFPDLVTPDGLWGVAAPFVQVFALSYRPNQVIAIPAPDITLRTPTGPARLQTQDMRASAATTLSVPPQLNRATIVTQGITGEGPDWSMTLGNGQAAIRQGSDPTVYDLALTLRDLSLTARAFETLPPELAPDDIAALDLDATVTLDQAFAPGAEPKVQTLTLRNASLDWQGIELALAGNVTVGPDGLPEGTLTLTARNWRALLDRLVLSGIMPENRLPLMSAALTSMSDGDRLQVEIGLRDGFVTAAGFPIVPLPRLPTL